MEKQGIITGIGNEITPEIDAVINEYIVGKNTILKGLELNGNILSAGTCILCGYRGTLKNSQTVDGNYVYGKFVIGVNETDSFSIITSSNSTEPTDGIINPTSITSAGTYYLRLYANGVSQVDSERYPKQADTSDRARDLIAGGTIDSTATTETAPLNDNSQRVANTEYVQKQIVAEIDFEQQDLQINKRSSGYIYENYLIGTIVLKRKAKYVIGSATLTGNMTQQGSLSGELGSVNSKFTPTSIKYGILRLTGTLSTEGGTTNIVETYRVSIGTNGKLNLVDIIPSSFLVTYYSSGELFLGYEI